MKIHEVIKNIINTDFLYVSTQFEVKICFKHG